MKRIFSLGLLAFLAVGCSYVTSVAFTQKVNAVETSVATPIAQSTSQQQTAISQNGYFSPRHGIRFKYPTSYVVDASNENRRPKPNETLQGTLEIWKKADFEAIKSGQPKGGELPPNISIAVHNNRNKLTLTQWKNRLSIGSNNARTITVAGQKALAYTSTGLYEFDNVLLPSRDGRIIHLSVGYMNQSDPSRQVFQRVISSLNFNS